METEIWKAHPDIPGIEVSTLGNVRTLDKVGSRENGTYSKKGHVLKQHNEKNGYLRVGIQIDRKQTRKLVHRLVAQTYIQNPNNLPQINHIDCDRTNNNVKNLEWCDGSYNQQYREKFGISNTEVLSKPVFAINLTTLKVSHFRSRTEASLELGVNRTDINMVIKGRLNQAGGYYFKEYNGNGIEIDRDKLNSIVAGMRFTGGVFAVDLNAFEVSRFESQSEASRELCVSDPHINEAIKGKRKTAGGYWFVNDDGHAVDVVKSKLHDVGGVGLKIK